MRKRTQWIFALLALGVLAVPAVAEKSVADQVEARKKQALPASHRHSMERRRAAAERRQVLDMRQYRDGNGVVTLTNRPEKYQDRSEYTEIKIDYEPIYVPTEYKNYSSPSQYTSGNIDALIKTYASRYMLDENLILAVIRVESNFNPNAVSRAGASGLMQLMPATAAEMGVTSIFDPAQNIAGGTQYLSKMLGIFGNDLSLALAAYNAGPEAVKKYNGIPPYSETQAYVRKVLSHYQGFASGGTQARTTYTARVRNAPAAPAQEPARDKKQFMVHFHSGLKQPADQILDEDPYYYIVYGRRTYPVRKELVERIEEPA